MSLMEIEWHPTGRQLHVFGASGLLASAVAALVLHFVWGVAVLWALLVFAAGLAIFLCSLLAPAATRYIYIGLTLVAMPIGFVLSFVLLASFYFLLLTPVAIFFRLIGRDPLCRSWPGPVGRGSSLAQNRAGTHDLQEQSQDGLATSYWVPRRPSEGMERYFHQF
jgi:hypothetical protein